MTSESTPGGIARKAHAQGYLQAMDLLIAHWPEDRKCRCEPALSLSTAMMPEICYTYCQMKAIHRTAAVSAGEGEGYANTSPY